MSSQPSYQPSRPVRPNQGVAIACILSGGLITAAIINSHHPVGAPVSQDSVRQQFEAQVAAAQTPQPIHEDDGNDYDYQSVKTEEVNYSAKDDAFAIIFAPHWQSKNGFVNSSLDSAARVTAENDGYGHYSGSADLGDGSGNPRLVHFTLR